MSEFLEVDEIRILRDQRKLLAGIFVVLQDIRDHLKRLPHLASVHISLQGVTMANPITLNVGDAKVATVAGFDQFGQPFPLDFTATPVSWTVDNAAVVSSTPAADGSDAISAVAAGSANLSAVVAGLSDSLAITVVQPAPVLTSVKISIA